MEKRLSHSLICSSSIRFICSILSKIDNIVIPLDGFILDTIFCKIFNDGQLQLNMWNFRHFDRSLHNGSLHLFLYF